MKLARNLSFALVLLAMVLPLAQAREIGASSCPKYERRVYVNATFPSFQAIQNYAAAHNAAGFKSTTVYNPATCSNVYTLLYLVFCTDYPWYAELEPAYLEHAYQMLNANGGVSDPVDIGDTNVALGLAMADEDLHVIAIYPDGSISSAPVDGVCGLFEGHENADDLYAAAADLLDSVDLK